MLTINANSLTKNILLDVRITGLRVAAIRRWIGVRVIVLGAKIIGCGVEIR